MPNTILETKRIYPVSGYDFARTIINHSGEKAVETLLAAAHGGETDWLEKKAAVYVSAEHDPSFRAKLEKCPPEKIAEETKFYGAELLRTIACALVALHNSRGGVLFIGINDANEPVPFEASDGDGIFATKGLEAYVRESVLGRLLPREGLFPCRKATWSIPVKSLEIEAKVCSYKETNVLALLVPPLGRGMPPVLVTRTENNRPRKLLLRREPGDVGVVRTDDRESAWDDSAAALADFHGARDRLFLSNTDLFGKLQELGIEPPPQKTLAKPRKSHSQRRILAIVGAIFCLFIACVIFRPFSSWLAKGRTILTGTLSKADQKAIEQFVAAQSAMNQGGDFLAFYGVIPPKWKQSLNESVPALVSRPLDDEFILFSIAIQTLYQSYALHATWNAEAHAGENLQKGFMKDEARDCGLRYAASALAIAEAATIDRLREGNLPGLLSLPPAKLPNGIAASTPYKAQKPTFRFEPKSDGSVIVVYTANPNLAFRMIRIDGKWVSEYWAERFKNCDAWRSQIEEVKITPIRHRWLMINLIVLQGITRIGKEATNSNVGLWADYWANYAIRMCLRTFFDDSFRPRDWKRVYDFYSQYASYPKLSPMYGAPEVVNLLDEDPTASDSPLFFHPDAESERKVNEKAERERIRQIAETPEESPSVRDVQADVEAVGRVLFDLPATNTP